MERSLKVRFLNEEFGSVLILHLAVKNVFAVYKYLRHDICPLTYYMYQRLEAYEGR